MNENTNRYVYFESTSAEHYELVLRRVRAELTPVSKAPGPGVLEVSGDWYDAAAVESISDDVIFELESL